MTSVMECVMVMVLGLAMMVGLASAGSVTVGDVRVSALSPQLLRIEPKGPNGFEDRATFNIVGRDNFTGLDIKILNSSTSGVWLISSAYNVFVPSAQAPKASCSNIQVGVDIGKGTRSPNNPDGIQVPASNASGSCCTFCEKDALCTAFVVETGRSEGTTTCWLLSEASGTRSNKNRSFGQVRSGSGFANVKVTSPDGQLLFDGSNPSGNSETDANLLHWPSPFCKTCGSAPNLSYAFTDRPRFTVPEWGPTPIPQGASVPPNLVATNGYDFTNNVDGDTYVFLVGTELDSWWKAREDFLTLTGPTPLLPDFAYGAWYTWYIIYTESRAKDEIGNWTAANLPLDVWGLDMNWRNVGAGPGSSPGSPTSVSECRHQNASLPICRSHFYNHPNLDLLPGLANPDSDPQGNNEWFNFIKSQKLRTYFNDHPFPVANQTTPKEVAFRYNGLSEWIKRGLTYWWFDHNWAFTLPGPLMPFDTTEDYEGTSGQVWGSHVYYESTRVAYQQNGIVDRPIALSRDNGPNWRAGDAQQQCLRGAGSAAHHRFPVWWTGDGVPLMASVESMVEEAVHDFRAFVHSDCGGHGTCKTAPHVPGQPPPPPPENQACESPTNQALLRWTAHCAFGTIMRFHQGDHRIWLRDQKTQTSARNYLNMRYNLAPSLISAGRTVQHAGFPLTARSDLIWPDFPEAKDPSQYIHLNASLIAPLEGDPPNETSRSIWIPPGEWQDGWTGKSITGPQTITFTPPQSEASFSIPMWHMRGSVIVMVSDGKQRINSQDWSELTIEGFPSKDAHTANREIFEQDFSDQPDSASTVVTLSTDGASGVHVEVGPASAPRAWIVRLHLHPGQKLQFGHEVDSETVLSLRHLQPNCNADAAHFPFLGAGSRPACHAGAIAEFHLPSSANGHIVDAILV